MIPSSRSIIPLWKVLLTILFLGVLVAALLPGLRQSRGLLPSLAHCRWEWIGAAALFQVGVYATIGGIFGVSIGALGKSLRPSTLLFVAMAFLFTTKAFAVAGLATLVLLLKRRGVAADIAQAAAGTFYLADYAGFIVLSLVVYFCGGTLGQSAHGLVLSFGLLIGTVVLIIAALRAPKVVTRIVDYVALGGARLLRRGDPHHTAAKARSVTESFYHRWNELARRRRAIALTSVLALAMHICETGTVACCARAFDAPVSAGAAAAAYVAGNLAALVSFLPGGVGFFEGAMAATLEHLGREPLTACFAGTLAYRVLALWLPLPIVLLLVRELKGKASPSTKIEGEEAGA